MAILDANVSQSVLVSLAVSNNSIRERQVSHFPGLLPNLLANNLWNTFHHLIIIFPRFPSQISTSACCHGIPISTTEDYTPDLNIIHSSLRICIRSRNSQQILHLQSSYSMEPESSTSPAQPAAQLPAKLYSLYTANLINFLSGAPHQMSTHF